MRTRVLDYFCKVFKITEPIKINSDILYDLECFLSGLTKDTSVIISTDSNVWQYVVEQRDPDEPDNYCHWIGPAAECRENALLGLFIIYSHVDDLFYTVRRLFCLDEDFVPNENTINTNIDIDRKLEEWLNEKDQTKS